jgi:hypothetical protein
MKSIKEIKSAVSDAYQQALHDAKKDCGRGFYRSRGRYVYVMKDGETVRGFEGDQVEWNGTIGQLNKLATEYPDHFIGIFGGIDHGEALAAFDEGWYEPWVGEWYVTVVE